jgi:GntP family gluconate:H+ symporter
VILFGILASLPALVIAWLFAVKVAGRVDIPAAPQDGEAAAVDRTAITAGRPPGALFSLLPILLPIVLILLRSVARLPGEPFGATTLFSVVDFIGHPVIALFIGMGIAFGLPSKFDRHMLSAGGWLGDAVAAAAPVIIITAAGGAFGKVLQSAEIGELLGTGVEFMTFGILLPFMLAAILKTAQGSSTVAIITAASLVAPFLAALGLDSEVGRALAVVAIGAGAMVVSHANDSYFWVVTQFSGMNVQQGYKLHTLGTLVEGSAAALVIVLVASIML